MKIGIILILLSVLSFAQERNENFISRSFQPGLPKEIPFKWDKTSYAQINSGDSYKAIYIVSRDSLLTPNECLLITIGKDGISRNQIEFSNDGKNESTISLFNADRDELTPLKLVLDLTKREINYRWKSEKTNEYEKPSIVKEYNLKVGKTFPIIRIKTELGDWTNDHKNKIIVINWWATSCLPCREEIPDLNKLVEKYGGRDIEFVAIIYDKENLLRFLKKYKFSYQQGYSDNDLSLLFEKSFPRHLVIDKNGKIIFNVGGLPDIYEKLDNIIKSVL
ncbi:MAG: TlpA disulfide reductase family protein [Ignavibacteriales bacterium]|nr:TlpA disulfide reductase family protein [Ignavibacteriales bacterium]